MPIYVNVRGGDDVTNLTHWDGWFVGAMGSLIIIAALASVIACH